MHDCNSTQEWLIATRDRTSEPPAPVAEHLGTCGTCSAFRLDHDALRNDLDAYRLNLAESVRPTRRGQQALSRALVALVEEDVKRRLVSGKRPSFALVAWYRRFSATWADLVLESRLFRVAVQGTALCGLGLFLAVVFEVSSQSSSVADDTRRDMLPTSLGIPTVDRQPETTESLMRRASQLPKDNLGDPVQSRPRR